MLVVLEVRLGLLVVLVLVLRGPVGRHDGVVHVGGGDGEARGGGRRRGRCSGRGRGIRIVSRLRERLGLSLRLRVWLGLGLGLSHVVGSPALVGARDGGYERGDGSTRPR